ncbi:MAG: glycoside hydrolase family 18 protein [Sphingobacteriaceae bacterium]
MKCSKLKADLSWRCIVLLCLTLVSPSLLKAQQPVQKPVVIGYVGGFRGLVKPDMVSAEKLTHINYAFVDVQGNRAVLNNHRTDTANFQMLNALKAKNPALKILISIGGWTWSGKFSDAVLTDTARKAFAASAVEIIRKYKLDGVDIDWEYPGRPGDKGNVYRPEDKENFTLMFRDLRLELDTLEQQTGARKLLTTAVGGFAAFLETTEMGKAQQYLDYINLMTYDFYSSEYAGHHTNLYPSKIYQSNNSADEAIKAYIAAGVPANKLVMGIAFYGRNFKMTDGSQKGLGEKMVSQTFGSGYSIIKDSLINKKGYKAYKDKQAKAPYLYNADTKQFITYDDEWSVENKCKYVLKNKMAGVMFWEYDSDPKEYLLDQIIKTLK